ncbi:MAG TPA: aspartate aminotransferase family protein [Steroidobacteraceae bacterium]|nr:aspartate aminotransferase family protein [Steroidobacteraceae bacterium]
MQAGPAKLPELGLSRAEIFADLERRKYDDVRAHWSRAFRGPADVQEVGIAAYNMFLSDNGLFALRVDHLRVMEEQVIEMALGLFHSPPDASGTFTSGGSESIYSALHAIREWAKESFPGVQRPRILAPYSAHPSFSKGCHYYGLELTRVPLGPDLRADPAAMSAAVDERTVAIVGSAPCWPYGMYDPIEALGKIAAGHGLWMHVDACVGGYLAPFVSELGHTLPPWDFGVPAVKSISADLHKYGYCPKPASTVLWRSEELKRFHHVHPDDWPGGPYKMQGIAGSRSAGPVFAAWAVMRYLGRDGYLRLARHVWAARERLLEEIRAIPGLQPLASDLLPMAFGSQTLDMQRVMGELRKEGWILVGAAEPPLINIPIDAAVDERVIATFLADLRQAAARAASSESESADLNY